MLSNDFIEKVDKKKRLQILRNILQQAVELEFGTIPIYLSAVWSIKDNLDPISKSIRKVVQEEMLHLALA
jgi:rubrerythrin